ncbi:sugar ABC transporter substrate-binding protein, partial [Streptomyces xanthophaeus]
MKGRYLRQAASGAALCLTAVTLTGCGAVDGLTGNNEVTLRVVAADYGDNPQNSSASYWKDLSDKFEKAHPGIKVEA